MRWVPDHTGRFRWRPYYRQDELDKVCEERIGRFLQRHYGAVEYPVSTEDLTRLIEEDTTALDLYADLSSLASINGAVHGVTTFYFDRPPKVQIERTLSLDQRRQARLRTTLAHEYGHVLLHNFFQDHCDLHGGSLEASDDPTCYQEITTNRPPGTDWMEWQAAYASGALMMPRRAVHDTLRPLIKKLNTGVPIGGPAMGRLIDFIVATFFVSESAAYVRLHQLGYIRQGNRAEYLQVNLQ